MVYYIKVEKKSDFEWLKNFITTSLERNPNDPWLQTHCIKLLAWQGYLDQASTKPEPKEEPVPPKRKPGRPPSTKKKAAAKAAAKPKDIDPFKCPNPAHKNYNGKVRPRTDCPSCWELYKKFHPMEYAQVRRKFELQSKLRSNKQVVT